MATTKKNIIWHPIPKQPTPTGGPPETMHPQTPVSSMTSNLPTEHSDKKREGEPKAVEEHPAYKPSMSRIVLEEDATMKIMATQSSAAPDRAAELMYHHWRKLHLWPKRLQEDYHTLLRYQEINGMKAHYLLDSGSRGVLLSPQFTWATSIKTFALEMPIALQLACMYKQPFHNQLWNECENQIQPYIIWWILWHSQHQILWCNLRNPIPKKAQHSPGLFRLRKHLYREWTDPHEQNNLWQQDIEGSPWPKNDATTSRPWQTMVHWCQEGEPHKGPPPPPPCGNRKDYPHLIMRVAKNREKIPQSMEPHRLERWPERLESRRERIWSCSTSCYGLFAIVQKLGGTYGGIIFYCCSKLVSVQKSANVDF